MESTTIARYTVMGVDATHGGRDLLHVSSRRKAVNRAHARIPGPRRTAIATLKTWKILVKLRCCPAAAIRASAPR